VVAVFLLAGALMLLPVREGHAPARKVRAPGG
jgi:hypothetical protein